MKTPLRRKQPDQELETRLSRVEACQAITIDLE